MKEYCSCLEQKLECSDTCTLRLQKSHGSLTNIFNEKIYITFELAEFMNCSINSSLTFEECLASLEKYIVSTNTDCDYFMLDKKIYNLAKYDAELSKKELNSTIKYDKEILRKILIPNIFDLPQHTTNNFHVMNFSKILDMKKEQIEFFCFGHDAYMISEKSYLALCKIDNLKNFFDHKPKVISFDNKIENIGHGIYHVLNESKNTDFLKKWNVFYEIISKPSLKNNLIINIYF